RPSRQRLARPRRCRLGAPALQRIVDRYTSAYAATDDVHDPQTAARYGDKMVHRRGIEVGQIFYFGDSRPMGAVVAGPDGSAVALEVADLGSLDGYLLPEFWEGFDPAHVAAIKADNWDSCSVCARMTFWENAKPRLDRLANRLDPKAVRMEIHQ